MQDQKRSTEDHDLTTAERIEQVHSMGQTAAGQLAWGVAKVVVTAFVMGFIALSTGYVRDMRDDLRTVTQKSEIQERSMALMQMQITNMSKVSDATVAALQTMGDQVKHNTYDVDSLKSNAAYNASKSRP